MPNPYPYEIEPEIEFDDDGNREVIAANTSAQNSRSLANEAWDADYKAILALAAANALLISSVYGSGRIVSSDIEEGEPTAGTGLTLRQPNASLIVQGRYFLVDEPEINPYAVINGILPNKPDGVDVFVGIDPDTGQLVTQDSWQFDTFPSSEEDLATINGLYHIGRAETDATTVTDFTPSTVVGRGIIYPSWLMGTGDGGGGEGGTDPALVARVAALENSLSQVIARVTALENSTGVPTTGQTDGIDRCETKDIALLEVEVANINPNWSLKPDASLFGRDYGDAQILDDGEIARDVHSGNTIIDPDTGVES